MAERSSRSPWVSTRASMATGSPRLSAATNSASSMPVCATNREKVQFVGFTRSAIAFRLGAETGRHRFAKKGWRHSASFKQNQGVVAPSLLVRSANHTDDGGGAWD